MGPGEIAWRARRAARAARESSRGVAQPDDRRLLGGAADWDALLARFRAGDGRPVLLSRRRAERVADAEPAAMARVLAAADRVRAGRFTYFGYPEAAYPAAIEWDLDPLSGYRWPAVAAARLDHRTAPADPKWIWELNRLQHLPWLAQAWLLTGDEGYADAALEQLDGWIAANPVGIGIAWRGGFEAGVRAISIALALQGLSDAPGLDPPRFRRAVRALAAMARIAWRDRSRHSSANNHLVGELAGALCVAALLPELAEAPAWDRGAARALSAEGARQVLGDGAGAEQAFAYQVFTGDLLLLAAALRRARRAPGAPGRAGRAGARGRLPGRAARRRRPRAGLRGRRRRFRPAAGRRRPPRPAGPPGRGGRAHRPSGRPSRRAPRPHGPVAAGRGRRAHLRRDPPRSAAGLVRRPLRRPGRAARRRAPRDPRRRTARLPEHRRARPRRRPVGDPGRGRPGARRRSRRGQLLRPPGLALGAPQHGRPRHRRHRRARPVGRRRGLPVDAPRPGAPGGRRSGGGLRRRRARRLPRARRPAGAPPLPAGAGRGARRDPRLARGRRRARGGHGVAAGAGPRGPTPRAGRPRRRPRRRPRPPRHGRRHGAVGRIRRARRRGDGPRLVVTARSRSGSRPGWWGFGPAPGARRRSPRCSGRSPTPPGRTPSPRSRSPEDAPWSPGTAPTAAGAPTSTCAGPWTLPLARAADPAEAVA